MRTITSSLSVPSAFHGGGVGAGVLGGARAIRTDIMVMDMATTVMAMATVMDMGTAADPEWLSYNDASLAPVITMGPLTAS